MHDARAWVICSTFASLIREVVLGLAAGLLSIITLVGCAGDKKKKLGRFRIAPVACG